MRWWPRFLRHPVNAAATVSLSWWPLQRCLSITCWSRFNKYSDDDDDESGDTRCLSAVSCVVRRRRRPERIVPRWYYLFGGLLIYALARPRRVEGRVWTIMRGQPGALSVAVHNDDEGRTARATWCQMYYYSSIFPAVCSYQSLQTRGSHR